MSKHTPEPWALFEVGDGRPHLCPASESDKMSILTIAEEDGVTFACVYKDSDARRIVTCVNACAGMADPASEIAELKRQRDELLGLVKAVSYHSIPATVDGIKCAAFPWAEYESMVIKAKGSAS